MTAQPMEDGAVLTSPTTSLDSLTIPSLTGPGAPTAPPETEPVAPPEPQTDPEEIPIPNPDKEPFETPERTKPGDEPEPKG